jgi:hypothetical protein
LAASGAKGEPCRIEIQKTMSLDPLVTTKRATIDRARFLGSRSGAARGGSSSKG